MKERTVELGLCKGRHNIQGVEEYKNSLKNKKYRPTEIDNMNELTLLKLFRDNKGWN